jgi:hypothetical protein
MTRKTATWLVGSLTGVGLSLAVGSGAAAAQGQVTICHRTGSPANPFVFMSIDPSTLAEHQAQGDFPAKSLAECAAAAQATPAAAQPAPPVQEGVVPSAPLPALQAQPTPTVATARPVPTPTPARPAPTAVPARPRATPAAAAPETAGARATPPVSALPPGGGEPDRAVLVLAMLGVGTFGALLRRVAQRR